MREGSSFTMDADARTMPAAHLPVDAPRPVRRLPIVESDVPGAESDAALRVGELSLRVGELAKRTGKTVRALHLYEELGLLEPARRSGGGYRLYAASSVTRVEWIVRLQHAGLSLPEIRGLLLTWGASPSAPSAMRQVQSLFTTKLEETRAQMARLAELERELTLGLAYLETCDACEPQRVVSACPSCDLHPCQAHPPVLVAGFHPSSAE
jgi:DNA-binding transcriptional MerR regulator